VKITIFDFTFTWQIVSLNYWFVVCTQLSEFISRLLFFDVVYLRAFSYTYHITIVMQICKSSLYFTIFNYHSRRIILFDLSKVHSVAFRLQLSQNIYNLLLSQLSAVLFIWNTSPFSVKMSDILSLVWIVEVHCLMQYSSSPRYISGCHYSLFSAVYLKWLHKIRCVPFIWLR